MTLRDVIQLSARVWNDSLSRVERLVGVRNV